MNISLSIGGWTGSQYFSSAVATASNRTAFVHAVVALVTQYKLDGIDFECVMRTWTQSGNRLADFLTLSWEYPNGPGIGCNVVSPDDSANFHAFLQELRADPAARDITLSAAVSIKPWFGSGGTPMTDVSEFAKVIDYIGECTGYTTLAFIYGTFTHLVHPSEIMNYDIWGSWSTSVGPNAPLDDSCSSTQDGSAMSAVKSWTSANFPADQIVLGVAAYGHSFYVTSSTALSGSNTLSTNPPFDKSMQPHGDRWDADVGVDQCGNATPIGGIFNFWGLVDAGFLNSNGTAAAGIDFQYDNCSQTASRSSILVTF